MGFNGKSLNISEEKKKLFLQAETNNTANQTAPKINNLLWNLFWKF